MWYRLLEPFAKVPFKISIKNGYFGASANLELDDYAAVGNMSDTACVYGLNSDSGDIIRIDVPTSLLAHIHTNGLTQFKITTTGTIKGQLLFDTEDLVYGPELDVKYGTPPSPLAVNVLTDVQMVNVYPNPHNGEEIYFKSNLNISEVNIVASSGQVIRRNITNGKLFIADLANGVYVIQAQAEGVTHQTRFVKF